MLGLVADVTSTLLANLFLPLITGTPADPESLYAHLGLSNDPTLLTFPLTLAAADAATAATLAAPSRTLALVWILPSLAWLWLWLDLPG